MDKSKNKRNPDQVPPKEHLVEAKVEPAKDGKIYVTKSELDYIKKKDTVTAQMKDRISDITINIMVLEEQRKNVFSQLKDHLRQFDEWQGEFISPKYGKGNINLETGEFIAQAKEVPKQEVTLEAAAK